MREQLRLVLTGLALTAAAGWLAAGCGTDAVGVDECRDIEQARCEAAPACQGEQFDVGACRLFYRDHCLHGMRVESAPSQRSVDLCVARIQQAAACARSTGAETPIESCPAEEQPGGKEGDEVLTACGAVAAPERLTDCAFLVPLPVVPPPDAGASDASTTSDAGSDAAPSGDAALAPDA